MSNWAFVEHATNQLMRPRPGDPKHPTLWPSEASAQYEENGQTIVVGKCKRAMFFRYLIDSYAFYEKYKIWKPLVDRLETESKPVDRYMLWIWAAGEQAETYLIEQAKASGVFVAEQVPVYIKSHNISGKKDIEIFNPESRKLTIVEAKSVYGFGANEVLGTDVSRRRGLMGTPRDSNLMQIALYHWWTASLDPAYEDSRLVYIARDTGRYAEYLVRTVDENGTFHIEYRPWHPYAGAWTRVPYTINNILDTYEYIQKCVDGGTIPNRDFMQEWDEPRLALAYKRDELGKTDREKYEKVMARRAYNEWLNTIPELEDDQLLIEAHEYTGELSESIVNQLITLSNDDDKARAKVIKTLRGLKPKTELKQLEKGDWNCRFCKYSPICYDKPFQEA